jgi:hypothetical protein
VMFDGTYAGAMHSGNLLNERFQACAFRTGGSDFSLHSVVNYHVCTRVRVIDSCECTCNFSVSTR